MWGTSIWTQANLCGSILNRNWKTNIKRTNCSRKVCEIESGSWKSWLWRRGWQMIICKRPVPLDDHLREAGPSEWPFARGPSIQMIICKRLFPPNDHLQLACPSEWSFGTTTTTAITKTTTTTTLVMFDAYWQKRMIAACLLGRSGSHPVNIIQSIRRTFQTHMTRNTERHK